MLDVKNDWNTLGIDISDSKYLEPYSVRDHLEKELLLIRHLPYQMLNKLKLLAGKSR